MKSMHTNLVWPALALTTAWALILRACYWEWSLNAQYSYGVLVPLLCVMLAGRRWPDRPAPRAPGSGGRTMAWGALGAAALILAALQPVAISNADWRMVPALAAGAGVTMTLCVIYLLGGNPWLGHFAFPIVFFLVAVPWPRPQENSIMSWLMLHNTGLCVEALHWTGYAVEQRGNLIAIPGGSLLGVEEACSGIRSLQSGIMVALAVGEFFRLSTPHRIFVFLLGLGAALAGNALRSLTLSVAACRAGAGAVESMHDGTGLAVLTGASLVVLVAGKLLAPKSAPGQTSGAAYAIPSLPPLARAAAAAAIVLWATSLVAGEAWFRWHEAREAKAPPMWNLAAASPGDNARVVPIPPRTLDVLLYPDTAISEQWRDESGCLWQSFFFHWPPGPTSVQSAFIVHDPRVCLGAVGFELESKLPSWTASAGGFRIPFQRYLFRDRGRPVHVFHAAIEDDGTPTAADNQAVFGAGTRWDNVLRGRRNRGLRVLELAVRGAEDAAQAERAAQRWLQHRIITEK